MTELKIGGKVSFDDCPFDGIEKVDVVLHKCGDLEFFTENSSWWVTPERWLFAKRFMITSMKNKIAFHKARSKTAENSKMIAELEKTLAELGG